MDCKTCTLCGATWMAGTHFWKTGKKGDETDLAGLVCNNILPEEVSKCINPARGSVSGDSWERRAGFLDGALFEFNRAMNAKRGSDD